MHSFCFLQRITCTSPMPSSSSSCTCLIFIQEFLTAPTNLTMWSIQLSFKTNRLKFHMAEWIIFAVTGMSICSPSFGAPFTSVVLDCFLLSMKGLSSMNWSLFPLFFFTWCDKRCCQSQLDCSNRGHWFFVWWSLLRQAHCYQKSMYITQLSWKQQSCQKCKHKQSQFDCRNANWVSSFLETSCSLRYVSHKILFFDITLFLFLALYIFSSYQSLLCLKNIDSFLCK